MAAIRTLRKLCQHSQQQVCKLHMSASRQEAVVISGRKLARQIREEARADVEKWVLTGHRRPHLSVVLVGDDPASHSYVLNKTRAAADIGISSETILKHSDISEEELLDLIDKLNTDHRVDGLLVQLPLPEHIDERTICNAVAPTKDVDGFHVVNVGRMCLDQSSMLPATPWGVWEIIKRTGIPTLGKNVVVAGRSKNVGMPIAMLLHTDGRHERPGGDATVTISHRYTPKEQLCQHTKIADIVIAAAGLCKKEGWLHHPSTWGCRAHDCSDADEKHYQSSKEHSVVSTRKGAHGSCILMEEITPRTHFISFSPNDKLHWLNLHTDWKRWSFYGCTPGGILNE
ncbi:unnamed protein product [Tetraodon nigroviridis]|uniref:methenyltetrahydrofolate cyclohydrolase n=1 Tax=Tetraodon nigroviridis TaxID=99883 RepID=Q4RT28_TETNG|nr:unnamed protein product [Tetraodon nigroviridis]